MIQHESFVNLCIKDQNILDRCFEKLTLSEMLKQFEHETETLYESCYSKVFDERSNMVGDLFEIFAECFFYVLRGDNRIGISNYSPIKKTEDNGVDGHGIGIDGKPATVQMKYRSNPTYELKEEDIKQFPFQSVRKYGVDINTRTNMLVFTTASGLHWYTKDNVFDGSLRVIDRNQIANIVDNNHNFWNSIRNYVSMTKKELGLM